MSLLNKKISEMDEAIQLMNNAFIPIIQGNPEQNYIISKDNLMREVVSELDSFENLYSKTVEAKNDAELAATNANTSAEQAEQAKDYLENQLFHYISDDDISVQVGVGTQILVSESTTGYPSVILQLNTL